MTILKKKVAVHFLNKTLLMFNNNNKFHTFLQIN